MIRSLLGPCCRQAFFRTTTVVVTARIQNKAAAVAFAAVRSLSSSSLSSSPARDNNISPNNDGDWRPLEPEDMPFLHHGKRPRYRLNRKKFKSPRKRASKLLAELNDEAIQQSKASNPAVWETHFRVGDAIELKVVADGGVQSKELEKYRGVVIGIFRKGLDTSILIRDVVMGLPLERRIPLHSPLLKSIKVLEENFVFKGKRKVKRAKLYYLRNRNPNESRVTKW